MDSHGVIAARTRVIQAALQVLTSDYANSDRPHYADTIELADEELALAARDLTDEINAARSENQPVGWTKERAS